MILGGTAGIAFIAFLRNQGRIQIPMHLQQNWNHLSTLVYVSMCTSK